LKPFARNAPVLLLVLALAASGVLILFLTWEFTFLQDTWEYLMSRREITLDTVFRPHNEHIVAIPVLIEQLLLRVFGMGDARPEYVLLAAFLMAAACFLFVYLRRRVGPWGALFATTIVLFYGPAWETLLWPFEICFVGSMLFGIAMLLLLERGDRVGSLLGCVCLVVSIGFSSLGIAFVAGALASWLTGPRRLSLDRALVFLVPAGLYGAWYLGWGNEAPSHLSLGNVLESPLFVAEGLAFTLASMLGLGPRPLAGDAAPVLGGVLLVALVAALALLWRRRPGLDAVVWPIAAVAAAYWFLAAFNHTPDRLPTASRYQYGGAILLLMLLAAFLQRQRIGSRALWVGAAVTLIAVGLNLSTFTDGQATLANTSALTRADTAAIEIARDTVAPEFQLTPEVAGTPTLVDIAAGTYLTATEEYGSPAYSQRELAEAAPVARHQADVVLVAALPVTVAPAPAATSPGEACVTLPAGVAKPEMRLPPGGARIELAPGRLGTLSLRRYGSPDGEGVGVARIVGGATVILRIPRDRSPRPWAMRLEVAQPVSVCPLAGRRKIDLNAEILQGATNPPASG
jgi:hypothetical protein